MAEQIRLSHFSDVLDLSARGTFTSAIAHGTVVIACPARDVAPPTW